MGPSDVRGVLLCVATVVATAALAQVPATPNCTAPINAIWMGNSVTFRMTAYSSPLQQTDSQFQATTTSGNYGSPVFNVTPGVQGQYTRTGFTNNTRYYWRARYENAAGFSGWCPEEEFRVDNLDPSQPSTVTATPNAAGSFDLTFTGSTDAHSGIRDYELHERVDGGITGFAQNITNTSLQRFFGPGTWEVRVRARDVADNASTLSNYSAPITVVADPLVEVPQAPLVTPTAAPANLDFALSWADAGTNRYILGRRFGGGATVNRKLVTALMTTDNSGAEGQWEFRLAAVSATGSIGEWGPWSPPVLRDVTDPTAPSALAVSPTLGNGAVQLSWTTGADALSGLSGHEVQRRPAGTTAWATVDTVSATTLLDSAPQGVWVYRVRAVDQATNVSTWSAISQQVTVDLTPPSAVTVSASQPTSQSDALVSWTPATDSGGAALGPYTVERGAPDGTGFVVVATTSGNEITDALPEGEFVFRVTSTDTAGNSTVSAHSNPLRLGGLPAGSACSAPEACGSNACVAGRCCDAACGSGCDENGSCVEAVRARLRVSCSTGDSAVPSALLLLAALKRRRRSAAPPDGSPEPSRPGAY